jgi:hypothetical protein
VYAITSISSARFCLRRQKCCLSLVYYVHIAAHGTLIGVTCFGGEDKRIVYGGACKADVLRVHELVLKAAERAGVRFADSSTSQSCMSSLRVGAYVFSAAGIVRSAASA